MGIVSSVFWRAFRKGASASVKEVIGSEHKERSERVVSNRTGVHWRSELEWKSSEIFLRESSRIRSKSRK